jgi:hypothetical protein
MLEFGKSRENVFHGLELATCVIRPKREEADNSIDVLWTYCNTAGLRVAKGSREAPAFSSMTGDKAAEAAAGGLGGFQDDLLEALGPGV